MFCLLPFGSFYVSASAELRETVLRRTEKNRREVTQETRQSWKLSKPGDFKDHRKVSHQVSLPLGALFSSSENWSS
jgi:hypothetical protein